jgi:hypothetical protein
MLDMTIAITYERHRSRNASDDDGRDHVLRAACGPQIPLAATGMKK